MGIRSLIAPWAYPKEVLLSEQFNYGHREVLLASNSMADNLIFLASLQHGWTYKRLGTPLIKKRNLQNYPVMVWSSRIADELQSAGINDFIVTGSPWVHLLRALKMNPVLQTPPDSPEKKIIFFPSHSLPGASALHNYDVANFIKTYGQNNVTVSLFWMDFIDPLIREYYARYSCQIACAGYRGSSGFETPWAPTGGRTMFLPKLLNLIESNDVIAVSHVSTPFWYALSLGKKLFITNHEESYRVWKNSAYIDYKWDYSSFAKTNQHLPDFPIGEIINPTPELIQIALQELGWNESEGVMRSIELERVLKGSKIDPNLVSPVAKFIDLRNNF